ncbi:MAG: hypothetical protein LBK50_03175 [Candidatus Nomurabacteria bacterium]|jgi:hypothetical protein|nr:hypothetical protein [Candidatus Nomurabacteria bacterium]
MEKILITIIISIIVLNLVLLPVLTLKIKRYLRKHGLAQTKKQSASKNSNVDIIDVNKIVKRYQRRRIAMHAVPILVPVLTFGMMLVAVNWLHAEPIQTAGYWSDYADSSWLNADDKRYSEYGANAIGSSAEFPYLIETAAEFAYLGVSGESGEFAGQYIKLSRGCNCEEPLTEIDFSAHYWDPVSLYGGAIGSMYDDDVITHIDGNNVALVGVKIDGYKRAERVVVSCYEGGEYSSGCQSDSYRGDVVPPAPGDEASYLVEDTGFSLAAGSSGLFGELYKVRLANFRLIAPSIQIAHSSGFIDETVYNNDWQPMSTQDAVGSLVGSARRTRILDSIVLDPDIDVVGGGGSIGAMTGGMIGYASGYVYTINDHVNGGDVKWRPAAIDDLSSVAYHEDIMTYGEYLTRYGGSYEDYEDFAGALWNKYDDYIIFNTNSDGMYSTIALGGLIGVNYHSAVMNSSTSTRLLYDLSNLSLDITEDRLEKYWQMECYKEDDGSVNLDCYCSGMIDTLGALGMNGHEEFRYPSAQQTLDRETGGGVGIGGLIGISLDASAILACIMNSYAIADIELVGQTVKDGSYGEYMNYSGASIGGLAGFINDTSVNSHAKLNLSIAKDDGSYAAAQGWDSDYPGYSGIGSYEYYHHSTIGEVFGGVEAGNPVCEPRDECDTWDNRPDLDIYWDDPNYYPITDNYYEAGSKYKGVGGTEDEEDTGRSVADREWLCDVNDPNNCGWEDKLVSICDLDDPDVCWPNNTETFYKFAETYNSNADLLAKLTAGLDDVARIVRGHLVNSKMLAPEVAEWFADHISTWTEDDGQIVLDSQLQIAGAQPDNECRLKPFIPRMPDTGRLFNDDGNVNKASIYGLAIVTSAIAAIEVVLTVFFSAITDNVKARHFKKQS